KRSIVILSYIETEDLYIVPDIFDVGHSVVSEIKVLEQKEPDQKLEKVIV
ncbi:MAG: hypothetical protein HRT69_12740, partial [Flavobacteriaceae bacterium]|nr:hypothetical protein [Flavobacteriaceae bacterium]